MPKLSLFKKGATGLGLGLVVTLLLGLPVLAAVTSFGISSPAVNAWVNQTTTVSGTYGGTNTKNTKFQWWKNEKGGTWKDCSYNTKDSTWTCNNVEPWAEGVTNLNVQEAESAIQHSVQVIADFTAPSLAFTSPTNGGWLNAAGHIVAHIWDTLSNGVASGVESVLFQVKDVTGWVNTNCVIAVPGGTDTTVTCDLGAVLPDGTTKELKGKPTDVAGNQAGEVKINVTGDTVRPTATITSPTDEWETGEEPITVTGTATDNRSGVSQVEVKVNDGEWTVCTGTNPWNCYGVGLEEGENTIYARATDGAGNVQTTVDSHNVTFTGTPHVTDVYAGVPDGTYYVGRLVPIYVEFSAPVRVTHATTPYIRLNTIGGVDGEAEYSHALNPIEGYSDTLVFNYRPSAGQHVEDLEYLNDDPPAIQLEPGDVIIDTDEDILDRDDLVLPAPGECTDEGCSLGRNSDIRIIIVGSTPPPPPSVTLNAPAGNEAMNAGDTFQITYQTGGSGIDTCRLLLSTDGGASYPTTIASGEISGIYSWTVPTVSTTQARVKVECLVSGGSVGASSESNNFTITAPAGSPTNLEGTVGEGGTGTTGGTAQTYSGTISDDRDLTASTEPINCVPGDLMKSAEATTVYYCGVDGKRYVFPSREIYLSWYADFSGVKTVGAGFLALLPLGGNVTYKPGSLIKLVYDPKVYVVTEGGVRHWVTTEAVAAELFGAGWASKVHDLPEAFLPDYPLGSDINVAADYVL